VIFDEVQVGANLRSSQNPGGLTRTPRSATLALGGGIFFTSAAGVLESEG